MDKLRESVKAKAKEPFNTKMQEKVLPGLESLLEALAEQRPEDPFRWLAEVNAAPWACKYENYACPTNPHKQRSFICEDLPA
jgi:hypothetical protein